MKENGFLYCLYFNFDNAVLLDKMLNTLMKSFDSLERVLGEVNVSLYTNIDFSDPWKCSDMKNFYVDNMLGIKQRNINIIYEPKIRMSHIAKAQALLNSPYKKTIFLDIDTMIHRKVIEDIFKVLDEFDFTCSHGNNWARGSIYPDLNTGVIGVRNNDFTKKQLSIWIERFVKINNESDQKSFREIFLKNKKNFYILPHWFQSRPQFFIDYSKNIAITHSDEQMKDLAIYDSVREMLCHMSHFRDEEMRKKRNYDVAHLEKTGLELQYDDTITQNQLELNKLRVLSNNKIYRLGDTIYSRGHRWSQDRLTIIRDPKFKDTILYNYFKQIDIRDDAEDSNTGVHWGKLIESVQNFYNENQERVKSSDNEFCINIRAGDIVTEREHHRQCYMFHHGLLMEEIKKIFTNQIEKITMVTALHYGSDEIENRYFFSNKNYNLNLQYISNLIDFLQNELKLPINVFHSESENLKFIDEQFVKLIYSKFCIFDHGGFGQLVNEIRSRL